MILPLTAEQEKLFKKLKDAYKACEKAGIYFANHYGSLEAYDKALVDEYADNSTLDEDSPDVSPADELRTYHSFKIVNEWADDTHLIRLTPKGMKYIQQKDEDEE